MYVEGSRALMRGGPNMFTLIAIGTAAAFSYSVARLAAVLWDFSPSFFSYFPAVSTILTLVLLGRYLEARSRARAGESMRALLSLRPSQALLIDDDGERTVDVDEIEVGDLLRVRPGEALPADGQVVDGLSEVDESLLTGESLPVAKAPGDPVMGGSSNGRGALVIRATRVGEASLIEQMQRLVEEAQLGRAPIARLADVVSGYFMPVRHGGRHALCLRLVCIRGRAHLRYRRVCLRAHYRLSVQFGVGNACRNHGGVRDAVRSWAYWSKPLRHWKRCSA